MNVYDVRRTVVEETERERDSFMLGTRCPGQVREVDSQEWKIQMYVLLHVDHGLVLFFLASPVVE